MLQKINPQFKSLSPCWLFMAMRFALVRYGGGVVQMSGSIGGTTFARNRFGNYARGRTKPINPQSARQVKVRAIIAYLVEHWSETLTDAERASWNTYADNVAMTNKLGETIHLSGFNHFIRSNTWGIELGRAVVEPAPVIFTVADQDPNLTIAASAGTQIVTATFDDGLDWCSEDEGMLTYLEGAPQNGHRTFFNGPWRGRSGKIGNSGAPITSPQEFAAIHVLAEGHRLWSQFRIRREDGRLSQPFAVQCVVGA